MSWTTPKTDWKSTDYFNIQDFNRINQNIKNLVSYTKIYKHDFNVNLNNDISSYNAYYTADQFNNFEIALYYCAYYNGRSFSRKTFYSNGLFIDYNELNRIEKECEALREIQLKYTTNAEGMANMVYSGEVYA